MPWSHFHVKARPVTATNRHDRAGPRYLVTVRGSTWLLQVLHGCYGVYIPLFFTKVALRGSHGTPLRGDAAVA